jgi:flagellar basal body L-ring protein FlgH
MGGLRRDLNDNNDSAQADNDPGPTVGGSWSERGLLGRGDDSNLNHSNRAPAGAGSGRSPLQKAWMESQGADAALRNYQRPDGNSVSSSANPDMLPEKKWQYKNGPRATRDDFVDQSQEEGSLWASSGQTNYYFTKNKIRSAGDLVTVVIEKDLYRDINTEIKRTLSPKEKANEIGIVQDQNRAKFLGQLDAAKKDSLSSSSASPEKAPTDPANPQAEPSPTPVAAAAPQPMPSMTPEEIERRVPKATIADVDIAPLLELKAGDTMMGEIIERYPNGNYKIRTVKRVPYKRGPARLVSVVSIVKSNDISEDTDAINSSKLYEYRAEVSH